MLISLVTVAYALPKTASKDEPATASHQTASKAAPSPASNKSASKAAPVTASHKVPSTTLPVIHIPSPLSSAASGSAPAKSSPAKSANHTTAEKSARAVPLDVTHSLASASVPTGNTSLQAREGEEIVEAVADLIKTIVEAFEGLADEVKQDNLDRGQFTQDTVSKLSAGQPSWSYVICHTAHTTQWDGVQGVDWYHAHQEFDIKVGGTIGYEIYGAASGTFLRTGDGGYLNWAYDGHVASTSNNGATVVFSKSS